MSHWRTTAAADVFSLSVLSPKCERPRSFPFGGNLCVYLLPSLVSIGKRAYYAPTAETRNCFYTAIRCARFTHALHRRHRPDGRKVENSQVVLPSSVFYLWRPPSAKQQLVVKMHSTLFCLFILVCMSPRMPPSLGRNAILMAAESGVEISHLVKQPRAVASFGANHTVIELSRRCSSCSSRSFAPCSSWRAH